MSLSATYVEGSHTATARTIWHQIALVFSNNYTTDGETLNLSTFTKIKLRNKAKIRRVVVDSLNGYEYNYVAGTNLTDGKVKIMTTAGTELTQASYPAGVTGDTVVLNIEVYKS